MDLFFTFLTEWTSGDAIAFLWLFAVGLWFVVGILIRYRIRKRERHHRMIALMAHGEEFCRCSECAFGRLRDWR